MEKWTFKVPNVQINTTKSKMAMDSETFNFAASKFGGIKILNWGTAPLIFDFGLED